MAIDFRGKINQALSNHRQAQDAKKADLEEKRLVEEARRLSIRSGEITPISLMVNLEVNEIAYLELPAHRIATVEKIVERTTGTSKKKGTLGRAVVGGVLLGPLGALGGAATAGSKSNSVTTQTSSFVIEAVDTGRLILTSHRFLFLGKNVVSLPYSQLLAIGFAGMKADLFSTSRGSHKITLQYPGMLDGEAYIVSGDLASDIEHYYVGITHPQVKPQQPQRPVEISTPPTRPKQLG